MEPVQNTVLPGALWVNIDKKLRTQVLHVDPGCGDVRDRGSGQYKPVGSIGRDGGWLAAHSLDNALTISNLHGKASLTYCSNCANKKPAFATFVGDKIAVNSAASQKIAKPSYFWVNQGATFEEERELGIIWAPQRNSAGHPLLHWQRLLQVKEGDVIFSCANQRIRAVSVALSGGHGVPLKPITSGAWKDGPGYQVDLAYEKPVVPLGKAQLVADDFFQNFAHHLINSAGNLNQTYLEVLSSAAGEYLLDRLGFHQEEAAGNSGGVHLPVNDTERQRLVQARIGQGQFREDLIDYWQGRCPATGVEHPRLLRASHIQRWADSSNAQRLDPFNGILLAAHIDAAFDAGLISFTDSGVFIGSASLSSQDGELLRLNALSKVVFHSQHLAYLRQHRKRYAFT
jgi:hypothetical protein